MQTHYSNNREFPLQGCLFVDINYASVLWDAVCLMPACFRRLAPTDDSAK